MFGVIILLLFVNNCLGACYFSTEMQGDYLMQSTINRIISSTGNSITNPIAHREDVLYSFVNITDYSIPVWGQCYKKFGNNIILTMDSGNKSCYRCIYLKLRSKNILHVYTVKVDYIDKCYTDEKTAIINCPTEESILNPNESNEIILYKTRDVIYGDTREEYCPIHGQFSFTYDINDGSQNKTECMGKTSKIDFCPSGASLNLHFSQCSFDNHDITFDCLGHWVGQNGHNYLALRDKRNNGIPQFRCAIYQETDDGKIQLALSSDSTCTSDLHNASWGYETLKLTPVPQTHWPQSNNCRFPEWLIGKWQHLIINSSTIIYKDHMSFKTYTIKCLNNDIYGRSDSFDSRYLVFLKTQCGEDSYNCIWIKRRSPNVLEFQLGIKFSQLYDPELCGNSNFNNKTWMTQAHIKNEQKASCPVSGEYTGQVPDSATNCAKLSSDCKSPQIMHYQVSECTNKEVYEERKYKCLGQWEENGFIYTYTQRNDLSANIYECFVGSIISNHKIFIMEAGEHCQRDKDPLLYGMGLFKQGTLQASCTAINSSSKSVSSTSRSHNESDKVSNSASSRSHNKSTIDQSKGGSVNSEPPSTDFKSEASSRNNCFSLFLTFVIIFSRKML